jgi:hypothetical protein
VQYFVEMLICGLIMKILRIAILRADWPHLRNLSILAQEFEDFLFSDFEKSFLAHLCL